MSGLPLLETAGAAMNAQRSALDVLGRDVAASQIAGPGGFERFEPVLTVNQSGMLAFSGVRKEHAAAGDTVHEMMALLETQRSYESDASLFAAGKHLAERTIDLERS